MKKEKPLLKAIFSTANFNGAGATLMSVDVGSPLGTAMYVGAVAAGTYNKYRGLTKTEETKNPVLKVLTNPSITASTFVAAACYNFYTAAQNYMSGPPELAKANLLVMAGWVMGLLGDNALRRLDKVNFRKDAQELGGAMKSKLSKTFNALVSNPTIFYGLTSTFFVGAGLTNRKDAAGNAISMFSGPEGTLGMATGSLVGVGIAYAGYRTWQAVKGKISNDQINDGIMNWMAFTAKLGYGILAFTNKEYGLSIAHLMFAASSIKVIYETRSALNKKVTETINSPGIS